MSTMPETHEKRTKHTPLALTIAKKFAGTIAATTYGVTSAPTNESAAAIAAFGFCVDAFRHVAGKLKEHPRQPGESRTDSSWQPDTADDIANMESVKKASWLSGGAGDSSTPIAKPYHSGDYQYDSAKGDKWSKANAKRQMRVTK